MTDEKNKEPRDEFDVVKLPGFIATPLSRLSGPATTPRPVVADSGTQDPYADGQDEAAGYPTQPQRRPQAQAKWFSGNRGRFIIYGVGTVLMIALQFRG